MTPQLNNSAAENLNLFTWLLSCGFSAIAMRYTTFPTPRTTPSTCLAGSK
jgi:hypothetical protein